jgi:hypothetical protein
MTYNPTNTSLKLSDEELVELNALKNAINNYPASVHPDKMERFTQLLVRSWNDGSQAK